jgi:hypothetical protein
MHAYLLAAVLFSILATGIALLWPRRTAPFAMAALVGITLVALHLWHTSRQPQPPQDPAPTARSYPE